MVPQMEDTIDVTPGGSSSVYSTSAADGSGTPASSIVTNDKWVVYVTGAVKNPGVYEVKNGARVYEALNAAGGFSPSADQEGINLAAKISDGMHVKFPRKGELAAHASPQQDNGNSSSRGGASPQLATVNGKIDINTASLEDLDKIPGVGPKTAAAIIEYRSANGAFKRIEDIMNVKGIGPKKFEAMEGYISIGK